MVAFYRSKLRMPTKTATDLIGAAHDRALVVAGVRDDDLLADLQNAVDGAIAKGLPFEGWTDKDGVYRPGFRDMFRAIVKAHGWDHSMSEGRRARVIFETNVRMARAAGRVKHLRDERVKKAFPWWQYKHGATRKPLDPREEHKAWDGLILPVDDPFWESHTPPNGYFCSCDFVPVSRARFRQLRPGAKGPDASPPILMKPVIDPRTGRLVEMPQGIGFGFDYQPGRSVYEGHVPVPLAAAPGEAATQLRLPSPKPESLPEPVPFKAGLVDYVKGENEAELIGQFLASFGNPVDGVVTFRDKAGYALALGDSLFRVGRGKYKLSKDLRGAHILQMAEAIREPDEIWVLWEKRHGRWQLKRHYIKVDPDTGMFASIVWSKHGWEGATVFPPKRQNGSVNDEYIERVRNGHLIYRRGR